MAFSTSPSSKAKARGDVVTLEEMFASHRGGSVETWLYALSPRSSQALLETGVVPGELENRDIESFAEPGLDHARQSMRYEAYSERRKACIALLRETRKQIIAAGPLDDADIDLGLPKLVRSNTVIEQEKKKLQKVLDKQQLELRKQREFEQLMKERDLHEKRKQREEADRQEQMAKEAAQRTKEAEQELKKRQEKKKEEKELAEVAKRELMQLEFEKEQQLEAQLRTQQKQREREAREAELERIRRAEEHRRQTQRILDQQELERCEAQERMEQNERMREQMIERKSMIRAEELAVARERLEKKKADNAAPNDAQREERRQAFLLREKGAEERRQRMLVAMEQDRVEQRKYAEEQEQKRMEMFDQVARKAQERVQVLRARQVAEDDNVRRIQMQRAQDNILKSERFQLRQSRSSSSMQQQQRVDEYQRQLVKQKVDADTARAEKVKHDLAAMLQERKMAAISMKKKQDKIKASMGKKWHPS